MREVTASEFFPTESECNGIPHHFNFLARPFHRNFRETCSKKSCEKTEVAVRLNHKLVLQFSLYDFCQNVPTAQNADIRMRSEVVIVSVHLLMGSLSRHDRTY